MVLKPLHFGIALGLAVSAVSCAAPLAGRSPTLPAPAPERAASVYVPGQVEVPFITPTGDFRVNIRVGGGPLSRVVFDTGSTGLFVIAPNVGSNVTVTSATFPPHGYESGTIYNGYVAYGSIRIGNLRTSAMTPFGVITSISCEASKPKCPGASGIAGAQATGRFGVMGVRFSVDAPTIDSPLGYLPPPLNDGFVVTRPTLYLGLPASTRNKFKTIQLARASPANIANGWPAWDNRIYLRWIVGGTLLTGQPIESLLDTGTSAVLMKVPGGTIPAGDIDSKGYLNSGISVHAGIPASFNYGFTSGTKIGVNGVSVTATAAPSVNTGWSAFNALDVMYDPVNGLMGFRRRINIPSPSPSPSP